MRALATELKEPLIDAPSSHSAVILVDHAVDYGLPAEQADVTSEQWQLTWGSGRGTSPWAAGRLGGAPFMRERVPRMPADFPVPATGPHN